jgi:hypothetical protein
LRGKSKEHIIAKAKAVYEKQVGRDVSLSGSRFCPQAIDAQELNLRFPANSMIAVDQGGGGYGFAIPSIPKLELGAVFNASPRFFLARNPQPIFFPRA